MYKEYASKQFVEEYLQSQNIGAEKDWLENNEESSSYIKNRTGGYIDRNGEPVKFDKNYLPENIVYFVNSENGGADVPEEDEDIALLSKMDKGVYDPQGFNTDIFAYIDEHSANIPITTNVPDDANIWIDPSDDSGSLINEIPSAVKELNKGLEQKFWRGTQEEYDAIAVKDSSVMYIVMGSSQEEETPIAPQVQADWNQNDSTAVDYIKNKPFYETDGPGTSLVIKPIDEKFLPDTVVTKDYLDSILASVPKVTYGTEDLTAGETPLPAGTVYFVYE